MKALELAETSYRNIQVSDKKTTLLSTMSSPDYNYSIFKKVLKVFDSTKTEIHL